MSSLCSKNVVFNLGSSALCWFGRARGLGGIMPVPDVHSLGRGISVGRPAALAGLVDGWLMVDQWFIYTPLMVD